MIGESNGAYPADVRLANAVREAKVAQAQLVTQGGTRNLRFSLCKERGLVVTTSSEIAVALCDLWNAALAQPDGAPDGTAA